MTAKFDPHSVAPPRIRGATALFILGWVAFGFGIFAAMAAAVGGEGAAGVAALSFTVGGGFILIGVLASLFGHIEARLIDIQRLLVSTTPSGLLPVRGAASVAGSQDHENQHMVKNVSPNIVLSPLENSALERSQDEQDLMRQYGITVEGTQFTFKEYRYDKLNDAVNFAKKMSIDPVITPPYFPWFGGS